MKSREELGGEWGRIFVLEAEYGVKGRRRSDP